MTRPLPAWYADAVFGTRPWRACDAGIALELPETSAPGPAHSLRITPEPRLRTSGA